MQAELLSYPNLSVVEGSVADIVIQPVAHEAGYQGNITGVRLESGQAIPAKSVVITTGTFLGGEIHVGQSKRSALHCFAAHVAQGSMCSPPGEWEKRQLLA